MSGASKPKFAMYWAAACGGCEISTLAIDDKILQVAEAFEIVFWPCVMDGKTSDVEALADGEIAVCLWNGGIRNSEHEHMARLLRRKSRVLVAFGSCAQEGCIPGLANLSTREQIFGNPQHPYTRKLISAVPLPDPGRRRERRPVPYDEIKSPIRPPDYVPPPRRYDEVAPGHFVQTA